MRNADLRRTQSRPAQVTRPAFEPVTVGLAKKALEIPDEVERHDSELLDMIVEAREQAEYDLGLACGLRDWTVEVSAWPAGNEGIRLVHRNATGVSSIAYIDQDGNSQTLDQADYRIAVQQPWPTVYRVTDAWPEVDTTYQYPITLVYKAGWQYIDDVPAYFRRAVLARLTAVWREQKEGQTGDMQIYESIVAKHYLTEL